MREGTPSWILNKYISSEMDPAEHYFRNIFLPQIIFIDEFSYGSYEWNDINTFRCAERITPKDLAQLTFPVYPHLRVSKFIRYVTKDSNDYLVRVFSPLRRPR